MRLTARSVSHLQNAVNPSILSKMFTMTFEMSHRPRYQPVVRTPWVLEKKKGTGLATGAF